MRTDRSGIRGWLIRVAEIAPVAAIGLLIVLPHVMPTQFVPTEAMIARNLEIRAAIDKVPWIIGDWRGQEVEVPEAAQRILKPNAMLSRRYEREDPDGAGLQAATFVLIHCSDTRDMNGHEPSVCYPNAGWNRMDDATAQLPLSCSIFGDAVVNDMVFESSLADDRGKTSLRILNFYVLPDGTVTADSGDLDGLVSRKAYSALGVAQIQLVVSAAIPGDEAVAMLESLLDGMAEPLGTLTESRWEEGRS